MPTPRTKQPDTGFTDDQRAEVFARDYALCAYSGASLWLPDYGAAPSTVDWIDHLQPLAGGGRSTVENGVCSSADYNMVKRDHGRGVLLFFCGLPTQVNYVLHGAVSPAVVEHLRRFSHLDPSDWFFNRAIWHTKLGAEAIGRKRQDGKPLTRGVEYRAKAALNMLEKWRRRSTDVPGLRARGLWPRNPSYDQRLLLSIENADTTTEIARVIRKLAPYCAASERAMDALGSCWLKKDEAPVRRFLGNKHVTPRVKRIIRQSLRELRPFRL